MTPMFFIISLGLGAGLAADAFSVSMVDGLNEPKMKWNKLFGISAIFAVFQAAMPLIGWVCVHTLAEKFTLFAKAVPWIALALLSFIGGKMLVDGIKNKNDEEEKGGKLTFGALILQGIATSIDALSVGFTIAEHTTKMALVTASIIAAVTFLLCICGVLIGKKFGTKLQNKAQIIGGIILIAIGIEIVASSLLGLG